MVLFNRICSFEWNPCQTRSKSKPGSVIGLVGNTGLTDENNGYLLGFEIRYNRTPQDPLPWLMPR